MNFWLIVFLVGTPLSIFSAFSALARLRNTQIQAELLREATRSLRLVRLTKR